MKVKELIEQLNKLDPELGVFVRGYEDGVNDVSRIDEVYIKEDVYDEWYYGQHKRIYNSSGVLGVELVGINELAEN